MATIYNQKTGKFEFKAAPKNVKPKDIGDGPVKTTSTTAPKITTTTRPTSNTTTTRPTSGPATTQPLPPTSSNTTSNAQMDLSTLPKDATGPEIAQWIITNIPGIGTGDATFPASLGELLNQGNIIDANKATTADERAYDAKLLAAKYAREDAQAAVSRGEAGAARALAAAEKKEKELKEEKERIRSYRAGIKSADYLKDQADIQNTASTKRISDLYDPLVQGNADELLQQLGLLGADFANAKTDVSAAGKDYLKNFAVSKAYSGVPLSTQLASGGTMSDALRAQGASTQEVDAATADTQKRLEQFSALDKWASEQLGVGQQNFEIAQQNSSRGLTQNALTDLAQRLPGVEANTRNKYAGFANQFAASKAQDEGTAASEFNRLLNEANTIRSTTEANFSPVTQQDAVAAVKASKTPAQIALEKKNAKIKEDAAKAAAAKKAQEAATLAAYNKTMSARRVPIPGFGK